MLRLRSDSSLHLPFFEERVPVSVPFLPLVLVLTTLPSTSAAAQHSSVATAESSIVCSSSSQQRERQQLVVSLVGRRYHIASVCYTTIYTTSYDIRTWTMDAACTEPIVLLCVLLLLLATQSQGWG